MSDEKVKATEEDRDSRFSLRTFAKIGYAVVLFVVLIGILISLTVDPERQGTFGDMFGFANAIISGLAFAGVIYAILMQQEELSLQREELRMTREELARSASAHEDSADLLAEQLEKMEEQEKNRLSPIFIVETDHMRSDSQQSIYKAKFINVGALGLDVRIYFSGCSIAKTTAFRGHNAYPNIFTLDNGSLACNAWEQGRPAEFLIEVPSTREHPVSVTIESFDTARNPCSSLFSFDSGRFYRH